jgi:LysM repeat protein
MNRKNTFHRVSAMLIVGLVALALSPALTAMAAPPNYPTFTELYTMSQSDNNIQTLAQMFGTTVDDLIAANNLADPANLNYGQQIWVPPAPSMAMAPASAAPAKVAGLAAPASAAAPAAAPGVSAPPAAFPSFTQSYTVIQNDNLWNLAHKFGTTVDDLAKANSIADPNKINVGQQLWVPAAPAMPSGSSNSAMPAAPAMPVAPSGSSDSGMPAAPAMPASPGSSY